MTDAAPTVEAPPGAADAPEPSPADNPNYGTYSWRLSGVRSLTNPRYYSPPFTAGPYEWHIMVLPWTEAKPWLGVYAAVKDHHLLPIGWHRCAEFTLHCVNQKNGEKMTKSIVHKFMIEKQDWGWRQFITREQLLDEKEGWLVDDTVQLEAEITYYPEEEFDKKYPPAPTTTYYSYDSKKETGMVGLLNQGATCYMNSLLQALYNIPAFRRAVFSMETRDIAEATKSIPLALQRLFYRLQHDNSAVSTKELTNSFGWDTMDVFTQHDIQELSRVLTDNLDTKMKGTPAEGLIDKLFKGNIDNVLECLKVPYRTRHPEVFYDLNMPVKGCKNIYESFEKYTEKNLLVGDNQYEAPGFGKQDSAMGVWFNEYPPVLQLHLKRFTYDYTLEQMVKVHDRFEYVDVLDIDRYLSDTAVRRSPARYNLFGVLVHTGGAYGGHYYAYLRVKGKWYKFDDEKVTVATAEQAINDNFGGEETVQYYGKLTYTQKKVSSAYMLIYVRESEVDWVMKEVTEDEVPPHLHERFMEEKREEEAKRKERAEAHLFVTVQLVTEDAIRQHDGPDLVNVTKLESIKIKKSATFADLRAEVADKINVDPPRLRFTRFSTRVATEKHQRPTAVITEAEENISLATLFSYVSSTSLFVEVLSDASLPVPGPTDLQLFFKRYDPAQQKLLYVGRCVFGRDTEVKDMLDVGRKLLELPPKAPLLGFVETTPQSCSLLADDLMTLSEARVHTGDIIVLQTPPEDSTMRNATAEQFYDYVSNRVMVRVKPLADYRDEKKMLVLEMNYKMKYDEVAAEVAKHVEGADPACLRFTGHMSYYDQPRSVPFKRAEYGTLYEMLAHYYQSPGDTIYYEVLDMPVAELENKQVAKVCWRADGVHVEKELKLLVPKTCTVGDVIKQAREQLELPDGAIRMFEVWDYKIWKLMSLNEPFSVYTESSTWHIEFVPAEEAAMKPEQSLVRVAHFARDGQYGLLSHFGVPFYFVVSPTEKGRDVKARLKAKLGVADEEWDQWKVCIVSSAQPRPLDDDDSMSRFHFGQYGDYFGLEHKNTEKKARTTTTGHDSKPLRIHG